MIDKGRTLTCKDCSQFPHPYMTRDSLWKEIGAPDFLCIPCLERRLGRDLRQQDLTPNTPANAWMQWQGTKLVPCDAQTAWTILKIATQRFGWRGLDSQRIRQTLTELQDDAESQTSTD